MSQNALTTSQRVLAESNGGLFESKRRMALGRFELTDSHIIYYKRAFFWLMLGALGMLLSRLTSGKRHLDIALADIASAERGKYGFNKKILDITMRDGTAHRLSVDRFDEFRAKLDETLGRVDAIESSTAGALAASA